MDRRRFPRFRGQRRLACPHPGKAATAKPCRACMLRLPTFRYLQPKTLTEALRMKAEAGNDAMFVAGGTDLFPNMKRRHQEPKTVISLMGIPELQRLDGWTVGTCVPLSTLSNIPPFQHSARATAARLVSTPLLRNMGTLGGNL